MALDSIDKGLSLSLSLSLSLDEILTHLSQKPVVTSVTPSSLIDRRERKTGTRFSGSFL